jgi:hypothetical protein
LYWIDINRLLVHRYDASNRDTYARELLKLEKVSQF